MPAPMTRTSGDGISVRQSAAEGIAGIEEERRATGHVGASLDPRMQLAALLFEPAGEEAAGDRFLPEAAPDRKLAPGVKRGHPRGRAGAARGTVVRAPRAHHVVLAVGVGPTGRPIKD